MVRASWRKTGRYRCWWRQRKIWAQKILPRYGRVYVDCHVRLAWRPSRSFRRRHTTQRHRQQRWVQERPEEKQIVAVVCEVRETMLFTKTAATVQSSSCRSARHTLTAFAPRQQVHAETRCRLGRSAVHGWPAAMQAMHSARLHSRLNSWEWVLVQVNLASSVPLRATIRMPTTMAISRKRSCTISADKTVVVARTLGPCAVFFLIIATTTRLLWASFGATLGQVGGRSKAFQAFFLYLLEWLSLDLRKGDFRYLILWLEHPRRRRWTGSFLQILASFCVSQWRKWQFWMTPLATVGRKTRDVSRP